MKKILSACFIALLFSQASYAIEFRLDSATGAPATQVIIPVRVFDFNSIIGIQGSIQFDVNVISYSGVQQFGLPGMSVSSIGITQISNGKLTYLWDDGTLAGVSVADSTVIFEIVFNVVGTSGQQSSLCFVGSPTQLEIIDVGFNTLTGVYVCGNMQIPGGSNPVANVSKTDITCFGADDGTATVSVSGGTSPYTYSWSNGATSSSISGLSPATYSVTVTDAGSAIATGSVTISQPSSALSASASSTPVTGCGVSDGTATVSVSGGTTPYDYNWSNGGSTVTINNLSGGTYTIIVTDANNCTATDNVNVSQPSSITASISSSDNVSCFGDNDGSATVSASGGQMPYTYLWSNNATTAMISGVQAGSYTVTVEDVNNCLANTSVNITEPTQLIATVSPSNVTCAGASDGSATVTVSGGTTAYNYLWSNGGTTATVNLAPGSYNVTVTDANGCIASSSATVTEPTAITLSLDVTNVSVFGGTDGAIDLTVSGGTTTYTYNWSNGVTAQDLSNITAGSYTVVVTDANSCTATSSASVQEPVSVGDVSGIEEIKIFPNPNNGNFEVTIERRESFTTFEILNPLGQVVYTLDLSSSLSSRNRIFVNTGLEKGVYVTRLSGGDRHLTTGALLIEY